MLSRVQIAQLRVILEPEDLRQFGFLFVATTVAAVLQVTGVASILPFMQLVAQPDVIYESTWLAWAYERFGFTSQREMLLWTGVLVFVLFSGSVAATALSSWLIQRSVWSTAHRLCLRQLRIYMQLPYEYFLLHGSTELLRRVVADVNALIGDVLLAGSGLLAQTVLVLGLFGLMLTVNPELTAVAALVFGGAYGVLHYFRHATLVRLGRARIETDDRRYATFVEAVTGMKSIRVADASAFFSGRFAVASYDYAKIFPRLELVANLPRHAMEIFAFGGIVLLVLHVVSSNRDFVEVIPTLSVFALATYRLMPALHVVFEGAARLSNSHPVIESLARDMGTDRCHEPPIGAPPPPLAFEHEIRLNNVRFQYETARAPSVAGVDITIARGERVALVGATGSGKTTLIDIAVGLLLPGDGKLQVDGVDIGPGNVAAWRRNIAYVPQDVFLYDDTVAMNITFGYDGSRVDEARLRDAARVAQIADFIEQDLDDGYDTRIGERGVRLSGGQRQRIGLARAIYRQPKVLLLDEASSALDGVTEGAMMAALDEALPEVTLLMIAHRLSTVKLCSCIYLIDQGRVASRGTYSELYAASAEFKSMVESGTHHA